MRTPVTWITIAAAAALTFAPSASFADTSVRHGNGPQIIGNGQIVTQTRAIGNFSEIEARGASDVVVRVGPAPSLAITADSNIIALLGSDIKGSKLVLDSKGSYRTRHTPRIVVTVPSLNSAALSGSGNMRVEGIVGSSIALAINGSGNLIAAGRADELTIAVNGSGNADARALGAGSATVAISGSGNATVATSGPLSGAISGSGNVNHVGQPSTISVVRNGSGTVVPAR
ncbi:DUF2807 domain-containing protein [Sphingomonas sp. HDW15A]|uniref:head GIN domain-containing protein n=1 Tax=Sphingomonas sp. HDW15A TaxID=2714942 RepID=UPI00140962C6|nr:head GIN domain-containing protein [Sphingomonas sp. HDW15A]QIK96306.1 DUF2807 domain-containing protein [Sphingomonas sp. HDW15A]